MLDNLRFWFVVLCIVATILVVGWKQPLRYRFMSTEEIYALENPPPPPPAEPLNKEDWMRSPRRKTPLDREAYNTNGYIGGGTRTNNQYITPYSR